MSDFEERVREDKLRIAIFEPPGPPYTVFLSTTWEGLGEIEKRMHSLGFHLDLRHSRRHPYIWEAEFWHRDGRTGRSESLVHPAMAVCYAAMDAVKAGLMPA